MSTSPDLRPPSRPQLKPALRRLWRDRDTLQLGIEPHHAVVLSGLAGPQLRLLELLDGSRDTADVVADAQRIGLDAADAQRLIERLTRAGVLDDATTQAPHSAREQLRLHPDRLSLSLRHRHPGGADAVLDRRRAAAVTVHGTGRVGATLAGLLGAAGVGRIACVDERPVRPADLSPAGITDDSATSRGAGAAARVRNHAPATATQTTPHSTPTLAVVAPVSGVAAPETLADVRRHPHLLVAVRETTAAVGPFVVPGRTPCIRCLELSRGQRDPSWPAIAAQLVASARAYEPCDIGLATVAASLAALHALAWVDSAGADLPPSAGGVLELALADLRLRRRSVGAFPGCGCGLVDAAEPAP